MKKIILGFIVGLLISSSLVYANELFNLVKVDYPIFVNGDKLNMELPVLNYEGNTYIPLRKVSEATGCEVGWNESLRFVGITRPSVQTISSVSGSTNKVIVNRNDELEVYENSGALIVLEDEIKEISSSDFVVSTIESDFEGFNSENIYTLSNGQIWQQTSYDYEYEYEYNPDVIIYKDGYSYKMIVEGCSDIPTVERIK